MPLDSNRWLKWLMDSFQFAGDEDLSLRATLEQLASFLYRNDCGEEKTAQPSLVEDTWDCYEKLRQVYSLEVGNIARARLMAVRAGHHFEFFT